MKLCERCQNTPAMKRWKYCKDCKKVVKSELSSTGYLQKTTNLHDGWNRPGCAKENRYETVNGIDGPNWRGEK